MCLQVWGSFVIFQNLVLYSMFSQIAIFQRFLRNANNVSRKKVLGKISSQKKRFKTKLNRFFSDCRTSQSLCYDSANYDSLRKKM